MFKGMSTARKILSVGGLLAGVIMIAFGIAAIVMGVNGRSTVNDSLKQEAIVGTPDMTPSGIAAEAKQAGLTNITFPTCSVAGETVNTGTRARCFASYMRIHALEGTGGYVYAQMGRYQAATGAPASQLAKGGGTDNQQYAVIDPKTKQPVANGARNLWVTETALTSALNLSYTAQQVALFGIVVGFALLLTGIGFIVLTLAGALSHVTWPAPSEEKKAPSLTPATGGPSV
jgi:hypothetical protein